VAHNLIGYFTVGNQRSERDLDLKNLGLGAILLIVFNQFSTVDVDLCEVIFQVGIVHFEVQHVLCYFVFEVSGLALNTSLYSQTSPLRRLSL
jgi:hypothetical protein